MKQQELIEIVRAAAVAEGYEFYTGQEHETGGTVRRYPAAWLTPPAATEKTGRREGEIDYRITLHLMALPRSGSGAGAGSGSGVARETLWAALERDVLSIAAEVACNHCVCRMSDVKCTPASQSLTAHGELSVALSCDVSMWYYL